MEVAPFFVDFHHFLSIFTIFYRFSRFTHFCRDLHFVAIYALFPQIFFGQNSLLRNITRFLHVCKRGRNSPQNVENKTAASGLGNQTSQRLPDFGNGWQYLWQEGLDLKPPFVWCPEVGNTNSRNAPSLVQISLNCNLWTEDFGPDIWVGLLLAEVYLTQIMSISLRLERWLYE